MSTPQSKETVPAPGSAAYASDVLSQINDILTRVKGTESALSVDLVKELSDRWERADLAYKCLAQISTEKLAENGMGKEATAISWARVALQTPFAPRENLGLPNSRDQRRPALDSSST